MPNDRLENFMLVAQEGYLSLCEEHGINIDEALSVLESMVEAGKQARDLIRQGKGCDCAFCSPLKV